MAMPPTLSCIIFEVGLIKNEITYLFLFCFCKTLISIFTTIKNNLKLRFQLNLVKYFKVPRNLSWKMWEK